MTIKANLQNKIAEQTLINEQLRVESLYKPVNTSLVIKDLINYVEKNQKNDVLVSGFTTLNDNPYKEKASCSLI